ncbi:MAG: putative quinol monooxygenase [Pseudomonadales bacterium]|jgi:quinol monooxygenase YgiN|tara:strand:- start:134 stop:415 length:282 start_codon:yes stop_codon:yes gene_type:complete
MTIVLTGYIKVPLNALELIKRHLPDHIQNTRREPGCLVFEVHQSAEDAGVFRVVERFKNQAAFDAHQARVKDSLWGQVTQNAERVYDVETIKP